MMDAMQEFYLHRSSIAFAPAIGSFVVCRKPDGRFYRAQILNQKANQFKFQCVDVGDKSVATINSIWPLEQRFAKLDRMAIRCALPGVALNYEASHIEQVIERFLPRDVPNAARFGASKAATVWVDMLVGDESLTDVLARDGLVTKIAAGEFMYFSENFTQANAKIEASR